MPNSSFLSALQTRCLPGIWSKGVALARDGAVQLDSQSPTELIFRIKAPDRPVSRKVSLWPPADPNDSDDGDYHCDCDDRADPCAHVAAALAALKQGIDKIPTNAAQSVAPATPVSPTAASPSASPTTNPTKKAAPTVTYQLVSRGTRLHLERHIGHDLLRVSLVSRIGGIDSGRIKAPRPSVTQDDLKIDRILEEAPESGALNQAMLSKLFPLLKDLPALKLDGSPVTIGPPIRTPSAEVRPDGPDAYRILAVNDPAIVFAYENGVVRTHTPPTGPGTHVPDQLRPLEMPKLSESDRALLHLPGHRFSKAELPKLITEIIPALEEKLPVRVLCPNFPKATNGKPFLRVHLDHAHRDDLALRILPTLEYPSPYDVRDLNRERELRTYLQSECALIPGQLTELSGEAALERTEKLKTLGDQNSEWLKVSGSALKTFSPPADLIPEFSAKAFLDGNSKLDESPPLRFRTGDGSIVTSSAVFQAWRENHSTVKLLDGSGFAKIPKEWLAQYGHQIDRLLEARRGNQGLLPRALQPELLALSNDLGGAGAEIPESLSRLKAALQSVERLPDAPLPKDLAVTLRHYQRAGVNWLTLITENGLGALLADDMGLGKTLQALCALRGRSLVVCPTSVLHAWQTQAEKFRPGLKVSRYTGTNRKIDPTADLTLTTYGLLRQDAAILHDIHWDTALLDEAQTIKNPDSQIARSAHALRAKYRIALSGTPIENRLEDLWSQFHFLNPGLLGTRSEFQENYVGPIRDGDGTKFAEIRKRTRPFILRRLKREVAPELPPRTEVVLECEFSPEERDLYSALLATQRKEVLARLDEGESVFGALELLLRLRQACCHPALVPGGTDTATSSAKLDLFLDTLVESISEGHRSLVFSQWTSFLDLIEPRLKEKSIPYLRLDGSTPNRSAIVDQFQDPAGPPVLLMSLKAGGVGLTLTAADHVFLMDSWWNPAVEDQAADRAHRIGQENPVFVYRLIAKDTVEEKILALQTQKRLLADRLLKGGDAESSDEQAREAATAGSLTREDLLGLLT